MSIRINPDACGIIETATKLAHEAMNEYGAVTVELAKQMVMQHGIDALQTISGVVELKKRYISEVEKQKNPIIAVSAYHDAIDLACSWVTAEMANKAQVMACLMLPCGFITEEDSEDEADICPCCGEELEYEGDEHMDYEAGDGATEVSWTCPHCGATGKSLGQVQFTGFYDVCDKDGNVVDVA